MSVQISDRGKLRGVANTAVAVLWMAIATSAAVGQSLKHDSSDRLTETVYPDGKSKRFVYDTAGNLRQVLTTTSGAGGQGKLPHTGISEIQCFQAGGNALVNCGSVEAIALSGDDKQDGMYTDVNPMSYSHVGSYSKEECVKDNVTGLVWEGKTTSGLRSFNNTYTNYGNGTAADASAYVAAVNAESLCGFIDWRLPTVGELLSIVNFSLSSPSAPISATWFPNIYAGHYWTSSPAAIDPVTSTWQVGFGSKVEVTYNMGFLTNAVRLVRGN